MQRRSAACWCNKQAKWSSPQGVDRVKQLVADSRFEFHSSTDWNRLQTTLCSETRLPIVCSVCKYEPPLCLLRHFKDTRTAACWCNGQASYSSPQGHDRVLSVILDAGLEASKELQSLEWYLANVHGEHDSVPVLCPDCGSIAMSTSICNLVKRESVGCDCRWKTQRTIRDWVNEHVGSQHPGIAVIFELKAAERIQSKRAGGRLAYDIALKQDHKIVLLLEVDGRQHFDFLPAWEATKINNLSKEIAATEDGIPMLRLSQADAWRKKFGWKEWLRRMIQLAVQSQLKQIVHRQPGCVLYTSGSYVDRRRGTIVEVV